MPFDFGQAINSMTDRVTSNSTVNAVLNNPIYTALTCVVVIMMITLLIFRDVESADSIYILAMRVGFWSFIALSGIFMVHNRVLMQDKIRVGREDIIGSMFTGSSESSYNILNDMNFETSRASERLNFTNAGI